MKILKELGAHTLIKTQMKVWVFFVLLDAIIIRCNPIKNAVPIVFIFNIIFPHHIKKIKKKMLKKLILIKIKVIRNS